jgi:4-alpha-glucanotransferase
MSELQDRLCAALGLAEGYWDVDGKWHRPGDADRAALLEGLGCPAGDTAALAATLARLADETWRHPLPPVRVVTAAQPAGIDVVLTEGLVTPWRLELESGGGLAGRIGHGPALASAVIDGVPLQRHRLDLPALDAGYHRLSLPDCDAAMPVIATPPTCFLPAILADGGKVWGVSIQLYSVRSARNWGIGDYGDLARLAVLAGQSGADLIGINPLHARSYRRPQSCSPYSPVSRLALDTLAIDVEAIAELAASPEVWATIASAAFQARLGELRAVDLVDHVGVAALKEPILRQLHQVFRTGPDPVRRAAFERFVARAGEPVRRYAAFEAHRAQYGADAPWWDWPADPAPGDTGLAAETDFQLWLQFIADEQLSAAATAARDAGMRIGLYGDLAVAAATDGAESWAAPGLMTHLSVGAPPDPMSRDGQNWHMPAPDPRAMEAAGFAPFIALLRANMRHLGALRIDHAMALARLFVMPPGRQGEAGTYLAYPFEALLGILALESRRARCVVIGEDLGTVPVGFREAMAARHALSYKVLAFERYSDGAFRAPADYPALALATASTHDLVPLAGYWQGTDIAVRQEAGLLPDVAAADRDRLVERRRLMTLFGWQDVMPEPRPDPDQPGRAVDGVVAAQHRLIALAGAGIAMIQLVDMLGETRPVNLPGTWDSYPNWRLKLPVALEDAAFREKFAATARILAALRPR